MTNARIHTVTLAVAAVLVLPLGLRAGKTRYEPGEPVPTFMLKALNAAEIGLPRPHVAVDRYFDADSEERKQLLLLTFFATYCEPCKKEMPYLAALYEAYRDKGLQILSITIDKEADDIAFAKELAARSGVTFPVLSDRFNVVARRYSIAQLPCVYLIDGDGKVIVVQVGYDEELKHKLLANIRKNLGEQPDAPLPEKLVTALKALEGAEAGETTAAAPTAQEQQEAKPTHVLVINRHATLRRQPAADAKPEEPLAVGRLLKAVRHNRGWHEVRTDGGKRGWVDARSTWPLFKAAQAAALRKALKGELAPKASSVQVRNYVYALSRALVSTELPDNARVAVALARLSSLEALAEHVGDDGAQLRHWGLALPGLLVRGDDGSAQVPASAYEQVTENFKQQPFGDRLAWTAAQQMLSEPCEQTDDVACALRRLLGREGRYLGAQPSGLHTGQALTGIATVLERFSPGQCSKVPGDTVTQLDKVLHPIAASEERQRVMTALDRCKQ
jgi:thiol-disulfide isomerase/thioredoxin